MVPDWARDKNRGTTVDASNKHIFRNRNEEFWNTQLAYSLEGLYSQVLDVGEVKIGDLRLVAILRKLNEVHCVGTPEFMNSSV